MASNISAHRPGTPPAPGIKEIVEKSSFALPSHNAAANTPPNTPVANLSPLETVAVLEATEETPAVPSARIPHTSARSSESDTDLEDGKILKHILPMVLEADRAVNNSPTTNQGVQDEVITEQQKWAIECEKQDDPAAADPTTADETVHTVSLELHEPQGERSVATEFGDLPSATQGPAITPKADPHEEGEGNESYQNHGRSHIEDIKSKKSIAGEGENESFGGDGVIAAESQKHEDAGVAPLHSKPPHMRPAFKAPNSRQSSTADMRSYWPPPVPRPARDHYPPFGHQASRPPLDYDELQRTKSQLMKARNDLDHERKVNTEMHKTVAAEKQASIGAAMADMLSDLLQKQAEVLTAKAKMQEKERDLQYREQRITQIETYLANGQKQLKWQLEQQGIWAMSHIDEANLRREVEIKMRHQLSDIEGKIEIQIEHLRHQEAAQKSREQQYKILVRDVLESELREQLARDMQADATDANKLIKSAYERGLNEGKSSRVAKESKEEGKKDFLKGYAACYRTLTVLHNVRNGMIAVESPEVAFLFDPTHPENPHNLGLDIGRTEAAPANVNAAVEVVISREHMEDGVGKVVAVQGKLKPSADAVSHCSRDQALCTEADPSRTSYAVGSLAQSLPMQQIRPTQPREAQQVQYAHQEQPSLSCVPPRSTFAGDLRGSSSSAATPSGAFASKMRLQAPSNASSLGAMDRIGDGVYAGRRIIRYEEISEDEAQAPNLIDLY